MAAKNRRARFLSTPTGAAPTLVVMAMSLYILSLTPTASALGGFCSMFRAECRSHCPASSVVRVSVALCNSPLVCCFRSEGTPTESPRPTTRLPYYIYKHRYLNRHSPLPYHPVSRTTSPPDAENYSVPPPGVCGVTGHSRVRRIVNGVNAARCQYPWMVLVVRGYRPWDTCGASLISDRHIITAAHCFGNILGQPTLVIGEYDKREFRPGSEIRITKFKITIHPEFDNIRFVNDIAMVTLDTPLNMSQYECIRPICIPETEWEVPVGTQCRVLGWGSVQRTNTPGITPVTSTVLQETTIRVVRPALCDRTWGEKFHRNTQICAGDMSGQTDSCLGDSGGPLMCQSPHSQGVYYLHGVVSLGNSQCAEPNIPALYTKVGKYKAWIERMMKT